MRNDCLGQQTHYVPCTGYLCVLRVCNMWSTFSSLRNQFQALALLCFGFVISLPPSISFSLILSLWPVPATDPPQSWAPSMGAHGWITISCQPLEWLPRTTCQRQKLLNVFKNPNSNSVVKERGHKKLYCKLFQLDEVCNSSKSTCISPKYNTIVWSTMA